MTASAYSAYSASADDRATLADINITPLVDVMLVLLVIFMISAPAVTGTLSMRLPGHAPSPAPLQAPRLQLAIDASGGFLLDGRAVQPAALRPLLADVAVRTPRAVLEISASGDADYQAFATALAAARASGLENVTFAR